jgi:hypothetical protein
MMITEPAPIKTVADRKRGCITVSYSKTSIPNSAKPELIPPSTEHLGISRHDFFGLIKTHTSIDSMSAMTSMEQLLVRDPNAVVG